MCRKEDIMDDAEMSKTTDEYSDDQLDNERKVWMFYPSELVYLVCTLAVVIVKITEIVLLKRLKRKLKIYEIILLSLSSSDFLFGLSSICLKFVMKYFDRSKKFLDVSRTTNTVNLMFVTISILHLNGIAFDRFCAIYSPLKHNIVVTRRRTRIFLFLVWIFCAIQTGGIILAELTQKTHFTKMYDVSSYDLYTNNMTTMEFWNDSFVVLTKNNSISFADRNASYDDCEYEYIHETFCSDYGSKSYLELTTVFKTQILQTISGGMKI